MGDLVESCGTSVAQGKQFEQSDSSNGEAGVDTIGTKTKTRTFKRKKLLAVTTQRIDFKIYIVGAGASIPYKRGIDDVGWFICYRHS